MMNMTMRRGPEAMPTPGGYVNPPVATPHGMLDDPVMRDHHGGNSFFGRQDDVKERDRPVCRRSVSMVMQTTPQIPHHEALGGGHHRNRRSTGVHQDGSHPYSRNWTSNDERVPMRGYSSVSTSSLSDYQRQDHHQRENHSNSNRDETINRHSSSLSTSGIGDYQRQDHHHNRENHHRNLNMMGDISEYYRDKRRPRRRHNKTQSGHHQNLPKFNSESDIHRAVSLDAAEPQYGGSHQSRHFVSLTNLAQDVDDPIPYMDAPCGKVIGRSPQLGIPSPVENSNSESHEVSRTSNQSAFGSSPSYMYDEPSLKVDGPSPTESNTSKESSFVKLFRSSKRWGSASNIVQRMLNKKTSDSSLVSNHSNRDSSTNHTPSLYSSQSTRSTTNSASSSQNVSPAESTGNDRISPSYPPPMRATLTMSQIITTSTDNSANNTPDYPTVTYDRQRPISACGVAPAKPSRTLDPFQQGLSQSTQNLRSGEEGLSNQWPSHWTSHNNRSSQHELSQSSRNLYSSQQTLTRSGKAVSAYSLNRSELGTSSRPMKRSDSTTSKPAFEFLYIVVCACVFDLVVHHHHRQVSTTDILIIDLAG